MSTVMVIFALLTVLSACGVVLSQKPLHSALYLVLTFFLIAVHFALLDAQVVAVLQVLVYAGAIMVLVIFVIMLLGIDTARKSDMRGLKRLLTLPILALFAVIPLGAAFFVKAWPVAKGSASAAAGGMKEIGLELFTRFLFPFELVSILLLGAIIAAVIIAIEPKRGLPEGRGLKAKRGGSE